MWHDARINIYQVESTSKCSARCDFCPHPDMERKKAHMPLETFDQVLKVMANDYFALHHFGEPLLNPNLPEMLRRAGQAGKKVEFSTNGYGLQDDAFLREVLEARPYMIRIAYDYFKPDEFIRKVLNYNRTSVIKLHAVTPGLLPDVKPLNNWAGQKPWDSQVKGACYFLDYDYFAVLQNGAIVRCCQDYEGNHVLGTVWSVEELERPELPSPIPLCRTCSGMQFAQDGLWKTL